MKQETVSADVWVNDVLAGRIVGEGGRNIFSYLDEYMHQGRRPIATTLPLGEQVETASGALPAFFTGLLPEGRRLSVLRQSVKVSLDNELALLLAVGGNTVGNIRVLPSGESPKVVESLVEVRDGFGRFEELLNSDAEYDRQALAGVQEKASARTIALPIKGNAILKISPVEFPALVENEALCLKTYGTMPMAKKRVVRSMVVEDSEGMPGLVVERFDGAYPNNFPVEDAAQLLNIYPSAKYDVSFESVCEAVLNVVASPIVAARGLAQQLAFAWLTGNGDLHAKNVSVIDRGKGFELSPVYDIPSTVPYGDRTLALPVMDSTQGLSRKKFLAFTEGLDLPEAVAQRIADEAMRATNNLAGELIEACSFDKRRARDIERILLQRRKHW